MERRSTYQARGPAGMTPQAAARRVRIIRLVAALCAAVLAAVLCILQVATPPSQVEPWYPADGTLNRELVMVLCALAVTAWGYSVRLRCSSTATMRCLLAVAVLLFFWLALTLAKWNVESSLAGSIMWYLFYLPMLAVRAVLHHPPDQMGFFSAGALGTGGVLCRRWRVPRARAHEQPPPCGLRV